MATALKTRALDDVVPAEISLDRKQMAIDVHKELGYGKLSNAIAIKTKPKVLAEALRKLEIEPFTDESVAAYKKSMTKNGMWSGTKIKLGYVAGFAASVASLLKMVDILGHIPDKSSPWYTGPCVALAVISGAGILGFFIAHMATDARYQHGTRKRTTWNAMDIKHFSGDIPEYVLAKAMSIKKECPSVSFVVDALCEMDERRDVVRMAPDPFLVARTFDEEYYVEVWDEEKYESAL